jgi:tetratricopeptide (TPR) repeat protein
MHSFWAREAERSFLQAAQLDPEAPMPHWGIAMVAAGDFRPRFQLDGENRRQPQKSRALDAARKAQELAAAPGKATDVEKLYIASVAARRDPKASDPDGDFIKALKTVVASHPNEIEARTYLALMLMDGFVLPDKKPRTPASMESVEILRKLMRDAPDHPGVHHFVIHGFEGSTFADEAWASCRRYAELVPEIPHAQHMPGHIYSQTNKWPEAIRAFEAAAVSERGYMKADSLYGNMHHAHNVHYLATSYSFSGDSEKALANARELMGMAENPREVKQLDNTRTAYQQGWFAAMRTLVQFRRWDEVLALPDPKKPRQKAWYHWARGVAFASKGDADAAGRESQAMQSAANESARAAKGKVHPTLEVAKLELSGQIDLARDARKSGLKKLEKASAKERKLRYNEPPNYPRPVAEALGHAAIQAGNAQLAERAYKIALEQFPGDHHAQAGLRALAGGDERANR